MKEDVNVTSQMAGVDTPLKKKPQKRLDEDGYHPLCKPTFR